MSGLAGWIDHERDLAREEPLLRKMIATLANRGPDSSGLWVSTQAALGHRRLAIVDVEGGAQPFIENHVVATLVGRIGDAAELRREVGGEFRTRSSVETLARAYLRWGSDLVEHLEGAFAFAIWDGRTRELLLGRDRFGIKPLYTFAYPGGVLFASEPKAICAHPRFQARLRMSALPVLLQPRLALPGETPLAGLHEVPPAHVITYSRSGAASRRYWRLESTPHRDSFEETARTVRGLMEDAVRRELVSEVPRGAMLSGGVDSASVAALALHALRREDPAATLDTWCLRFEADTKHFVATELRPDIDAPYAQSAADFLGSRHQTLVVSMDELFAVIPATRSARDLPGWGQFDASMYVLFREMHGRCKVALTGEAADEIFGGYPYCFNRELLARQQFPWLGTGPRLSACLSPEVTRSVDPVADERARYEQLIAEVPRLDGDDPENARMREVLYLGMCGPLSVILDRKDRMSASNGVEVRLPFLDRRLVEYVWNVPWSMKSRGGVKGLLKAAMADSLPPSTLERKKSAYPHLQSPDHDRMLIDEATRIVEDRRSHIAPLFNMSRLREVINDLDSARRAGDWHMLPGGASPAYLLINLIELERWIDDHGVSIC